MRGRGGSPRNSRTPTRKGRSRKERDEFQHKNEEFDEQRAALLSKATDEAKAESQRLLDEARQAADALSAKRQETIETRSSIVSTKSVAGPSRKCSPSRARR
jgi:F0F1-type ATP synthase membrane subunit b/b'